jgi:beta-glucosidase/6-phospho-beta-glucosidase/beta-galactosidase
MAPMRALALFAPLALAACTSSPASTPTPPEPVTYGALGSLVGEAGKGGFRFGASSAATQIEDQNHAVDWAVWTAPEAEGGLGKGEDPLGDASLGYTKAIEDVGLLVELGVDSYRFSIDWARVEPERDVIDEEALAHYDAFLDALVAAGIRPMVTIHHFSNPVWVDDPRGVDCAGGPTDQNLCGWNHPEGAPLVLAELDEHVRLLAERFGDRVDEWCTVNEPINYMLAGYGIGNFPPGNRASSTRSRGSCPWRATTSPRTW